MCTVERLRNKHNYKEAIHRHWVHHPGPAWVPSYAFITINVYRLAFLSLPCDLMPVGTVHSASSEPPQGRLYSDRCDIQEVLDAAVKPLWLDLTSTVLVTSSSFIKLPSNVRSATLSSSCVPEEIDAEQDLSGVVAAVGCA